MSDVRFIFLAHISINDIRYDLKWEERTYTCNNVMQKKIIAFDSFKPSVVHSHVHVFRAGIISSQLTLEYSIRKQRYSFSN